MVLPEIQFVTIRAIRVSNSTLWRIRKTERLLGAPNSNSARSVPPGNSAAPTAAIRDSAFFRNPDFGLRLFWIVSRTSRLHCTSVFALLRRDKSPRQGDEDDGRGRLTAILDVGCFPCCSCHLSPATCRVSVVTCPAHTTPAGRI